MFYRMKINFSNTGKGESIGNQKKEVKLKRAGSLSLAYVTFFLSFVPKPLSRT